MSTSIWAGGPEGRIGRVKGVLGARYRRFIGVSMAQRAIAYAPLPNGAMIWDIMSASPPASLPRRAGYPPIFAIWRRSGGSSKSMYSKVAGISGTDGKNRRYASSSRFDAQRSQSAQLKLCITHIHGHFRVRRSPVWALARVPGHSIRRRVGLLGPRYRRIWLNQILCSSCSFPGRFLDQPPRILGGLAGTSYLNSRRQRRPLFSEPRRQQIRRHRRVT